jgi:NAD(P)-dependent dehydrogenase (short-subunit alcohol dehydrogenase family)
MNKPVVLVTGALTGIGRATALAFAREGARVVVSGRHDEEGHLRRDLRHERPGYTAEQTKERRFWRRACRSNE